MKSSFPKECLSEDRKRKRRKRTGGRRSSRTGLPGLLPFAVRRGLAGLPGLLLLTTTRSEENSNLKERKNNNNNNNNKKKGGEEKGMVGLVRLMVVVRLVVW
jgi:hypothetical protein